MKKLIVLILMFLLTGCYDYQELSELAIIKGASIDIKENEYVLNYALTNDNSKPTFLKGKGKTISEAISDMSLTSPKELYIGHMLVLIISEDVAKKGLNDVTDYFFRNPLSKKTFQLVISDISAEKVLKTISPLETFQVESISKNLTGSTSLSTFIINTTLLSFTKTIKDPGINPVINGITIEDEYAKIKPLAIFKDDKFIKWTTSDISKGLAILFNQSNSFEIATNQAIFKMNDVKVTKTFEIEDKIYFNFKIDANTKIEEMNSDYSLKELEKMLINSIKSILNETINEIKTNNIDPLGIGLYIYQNDYENYLKLKDDYLKCLEVNFEINPNLMHEENSSKGVKNE